MGGEPGPPVFVVERVANPFTVYGDPRSTAADSSDWDVAFIVTTISKDEFEREYPDAEKVDWDHDFRDCPLWLDGDDLEISAIHGIEQAQAGELTFVSNPKYVAAARSTRAATLPSKSCRTPLLPLAPITTRS